MSRFKDQAKAIDEGRYAAGFNNAIAPAHKKKN